MERNIIILVFVFLSATGPRQVQINEPAEDFRSMEGTLIEHPFPDDIDSLSGQEILELQNDNGVSLWFARDIFKDVCMTGQCKMISLWLFWDGTGNYLGIKLDENEPLTKSDHTEFGPADYNKLDEILHNPSSILRNLRPEDLTVDEEPDSKQEVDGITSATDPTLEHLVVKGAIYTCHTLWHTVYGHTREKIQMILEQRIDHDYLKHLFENDNPVYSLWAIDYVSGNYEYHGLFYKDIASLIKSDNRFLAERSLDYFQPDQLSDRSVQLFLISILNEVGHQRQLDLIWKFVHADHVDVEVVLTLLDLLEKQQLGTGALYPVFRLIRPEHVPDRRIEKVIRKLASSDNRYVRFQTEKLLNEKFNL